MVNLADNDKLGIQLGISVDQKSINDLGNDISKKMKPIKIKTTFDGDGKKKLKEQTDYSKAVGETVSVVRTLNKETGKYNKIRIETTDNAAKQRALDAQEKKDVSEYIRLEKQRIAAIQKRFDLEQRAMKALESKADTIQGNSMYTTDKAGSISDRAIQAGVSTTALDAARTNFSSALTGLKQGDISSYERLISAQKRLAKETQKTRSVMGDTTAINRNATAMANLERQIRNYLKVHGKVKSKGGALYSEATGILDSIKGGKISTSDATRQFAEVRARIKEAGLEAKTFGQSVREAFGRYAAIGFATTGLLMIKQTLKKMITAVRELDASIVDLQVATGMSNAEAEKLLTTYSKLGKELGATTVQVAKAADAWLRQGFSIEDTNVLIKESTMLSKLGQIESAEATKYLTSAMRGYKVEVDEVSRITDRLTAVDMEAAVSAGGIAEAMSMTANGAKLAGVEMDKLIGILTAVAEVSQQDPSRVGTTFKTVFGRMSNVKLGKLQDEDGTDITEELNNVEAVLNRIGVPLRKNAMEWNNFGDVLDKLAVKWSTLSSVEQSAIATALGGVRQKEAVLTLMENYDKVLQYESVALESSGTALQKFEDAYLGSMEAKTNALKASFESVSRSIVTSDILKTITDIASSTLSWLDGTDRMGSTLARVLGVATAIGIVLKRNALAGGISNLIQYGGTIGAFGSGGVAGLNALTTATQGLSKARLMSVITTNKLSVAEASKLLIGNGVERQERIAILTKLGYINAEKAQTTSTMTHKGALLNKKLIALGVSDEERMAILTKLGYIKVQSTQTLSTATLTTAIKGLGLAMKDALVSTLAFLSTNPVGWAILVVGGLFSVSKALDWLSKKLERANEAMKESQDAFNAAQTEIESANSELETTQKRMTELQAIQSPTLMEQEELTNLKEANDKLLLQIGYLKEKAEILKAEGKGDVDKAVKHVFPAYAESTGLSPWETTPFGNENIGVAGAMKTYTSEYADAVKEIERIAIKGETARAKEKKRLKSLEKETLQYKNKLIEYYETYSLIYDFYGNTDPLGKNALSEMQKIMGVLGDPSAKISLASKFEEALKSTPKLKDELDSLSSSQKLNEAEVSSLISKYPEFKKTMDDLGISVEQVVVEFSTASDPIAEMNKSISDLQTTIEGLPKRMEDLEAINKKVSNGYHFSITEIDEIVKKYPQLESAVTRTAHGFQIASGAINTLSTGVSFTSDEIEFLEKKHGTLNATLDEATGLYYLNSDALSAIGTSAIQAKISYNQFQIDATKSALDGARARIEALKSETGALTTFMATLALVKQSGDTGSVLTSSEFWMMKRDGIKSVSGYSNYDEYVSGRISGISGSQAQAMREAQKQLEQYQSQLDRIGTGSVSGYTPEKPKAKTAEELLEEEKKRQKDAFGAQKAIIDRQLALNLITEEQYTNSLEALYKQFYSDKSKYLAEYTQYEIEVYNKRQSFLEQAQKDLESLHKATMDMIKKEKEQEKDALEKKKDGLKEYTDARKKALQDARDQDSYDKKIREKSTDIESIKAQLMGLSGDMSGAGMRKKTELTQRLKEAQDELSEAVADRQYEMQVEALDASYEAQEKNIDAQIEGIDAFLNNQNTLVKASFDRMNGMSATLKSQLIAYNKEYGDGIANDIVKNWDAATEALKKYGSAANVETTLSVITTNIGRASSQVPTGYANGTSGLKRDSIIVGTHELLLNKTGSNAYQMMNAGSPIFTEQQTNALKAILSSPNSLLTKTVGGVGLKNASTIMSMVNSNNSPSIEINYEMNISGTDPQGIKLALAKEMPKFSDYVLNKINKDVQFNKGVRLTAANMT